MRIAIFTLGCRLNFAETEEMIEKFQKNRYQISFQGSQVCIVRGCSVTKKAEKETRQKIKELKKKNNIHIVAAGCLKKNFSCPEADLILPKNQEPLIFEKIKKFIRPSVEKVNSSPKTRTRSFIKIQDGCQNFCAYCLIPYLRGKEKPVSSKEIIRKIQEKEKQDFKEVVLCGVNIGKWQERIKTKNLTWLIKEILDKTKIERIRISSLWPDKIDNKLLETFKNKRICRHLHLSLQSLSNSTLKRMGRNYKVNEIKDKIKKIKKRFSDLTLTADIITGFPNESEKEFQETVKNLKEIKIAKIHVFRYSPHQETKAGQMKNQIPEKIKKKRAKILLKLSKNLEKKWRKKFLGKIREVLFEQEKGDFWQGLTDNYLKVFVRSKRNLTNQVLSVRMRRLYKEGILGRMEDRK